MHKKLALVSLLAVSLSGFAYGGSIGDLILGFRDDGSDGGTGITTNTTIDLGNYGMYEPGGSFYDPGVTESLGINLTTDGLAITYGANYLTDTGLYFGVVATNGTGSSLSTLFVSAAATGGTPGVPNSTAWTIRSASLQTTQAGKFEVLEFANTPGFNGVMRASSSNNSNSWTEVEGNSNGLSFGAFTTTLFEETAPGGSAIDFYEMNPQSNGPGVGNPGVFLGTFSISSSGNLDFTAAAIPEPPAVAAILAGAAFGFILWRRGGARMRQGA
jgi:hypothetical protein